MADIFISYAGEDRPWVEKFASALAEQGWSVWWDRSIPFGQSYQTVIEQALADAHCVFVIWSAHSVDSSWVWAEAEEARNRNILIPIVIDKSQPPLVFRQIQTADLSHWQIDPPTDLDAKLLRDLESLLGRKSRPLAPSKPPVTGSDNNVEQPQSSADYSQNGRWQQPVKRPVKASLTRYLIPLALLVLVAIGVIFFFNGNQSSWPKIEYFLAAPATVIRGGSTTLSWQVEDAQRAELIGIGELGMSGSKIVEPIETTTYVLVVSNNTGHTIQRELEVTVLEKSVSRDSSDNVEALLKLARQAIKDHDFQQAEALLKEAQSIAPDSVGIKKTLDYFAAEAVKELLALARQAIKARNFTGAKDLLSQAQQAAPNNENVQQTVDYFKVSKTLYDQRLAAEKKLQLLQQAEAKAKATALKTVKSKEQTAEKYQQELEAKKRQQAYELQQKQLEQIKAQEQLAAKQREQGMTEAQRLQMEEDEKALAVEAAADAHRKEKIKDFLKFIRR